MNGPREKWISEGRPTTTDVPSFERQPFAARPGDQSIRAFRHEVIAALDEDVKNYDGSWTEWGSLVDVPIEKGL